MATSSVSLKLFIDNKSQKVLFAEAGKDFVDFLFNLLALPVGTITRLSLQRTQWWAASATFMVASKQLAKATLYKWNILKKFCQSPNYVQAPYLECLSCLVVKPISSFTKKKSVQSRRKKVHLGMVQGVKLLKASLQSKTVLTSVFLHDSNA